MWTSTLKYNAADVLKHCDGNAEKLLCIYVIQFHHTNMTLLSAAIYFSQGSCVCVLRYMEKFTSFNTGPFIFSHAHTFFFKKNENRQEEWQDLLKTKIHNKELVVNEVIIPLYKQTTCINDKINIAINEAIKLCLSSTLTLLINARWIFDFC